MSRKADSPELERIERLEDAREDWIRLGERSGHPFATWEWNQCWWELFGEDRELYSFRCRDGDGEVAAILPLYVAAEKPARIARFLGYADLHSPVCSEADRELAARGMIEATRQGRGSCRLIVAERMPVAEGWGELVGGKVMLTSNDPVLPIDGRSWDDFLASRSRNFRSQVRGRERKLIAETGVSFRLAEDPDRLDEDMESLFRLHGARWEGETTGIFEGDRAEFHRRFARLALGRGWLRLWIAEIEGKAVAAWYGWRFAGAEWYFQAGRDMGYEDLSLGFVMLAHTVRAAFDDGAGSYHFLAGDEPYKARFASEDDGAEDRLVGSAASVRAASLALSLASRLPDRLSRRAAGLTQ